VTAEGVLQIGKELAAAQKRLANHGNGTFGKWAQDRCGISRDLAYKCISVHKTFGPLGLSKISTNFSASSLYLLAKQTCPKEATKEAIELAAAFS